jgi:hypothetical protein
MLTLLRLPSTYPPKSIQSPSLSTNGSKRQTKKSFVSPF